MSTTETYTIQQVAPENFDVLLPLMQDCFGIDTNVSYFHWKYTQNPAGNFIGFVAVADSTGEIGAYYGVIPELFSVQGKRQVIYQSCDTMTHSRHRRRGLFQLLAVHCYNYLRAHGQLFVYGFGGGQSTPGFIKFGWRHIFDIAYYFYPRQMRLLDLPQLFANANKVVPVHDHAQLADLLLKSNRGTAVHALKEVAQFSWRLANPRHAYQTLAYADASGKFTGYVVYYVEDQKVFLFDGFAESRQAERALFGALKALLRADGSLRGIVSLCQPGQRFSQSLTRNWFVRNTFSKGPLRETIPFILYADTATMDDIGNANAWAINAYDNDAL
ncbi:GNAT family N-acetyltransferase [Hymenobacter monticola]|uniref:GNAT family N-acetyltransferase n=1 Tax=Hymenobacter monticola TaxID=1705399 RepID=A0ABY4AYD2_9BACT|nr:GNAT family N-acetyltransferase [Hymenobacter monticola]UOE31864.1 GNAT family N-acetyltransferase [Hymenobacter monticola]